MKRFLLALLSAGLLLSLAGCAPDNVSVSNVKGYYVKEFSVSGQVIFEGAKKTLIGGNSTIYNEESFPDHNYLRVELDAAFLSVDSSAKPDSDDFRKAVYGMVKSCTELTAAGEKIEPIWGFWPKSAGKNWSKQMTLLYLVPKSVLLSDLKLAIDGTALGDPAYHYEFTDFKED